MGVFTRKGFWVRVFVAIVRGTAYWVNACVRFDRRGTDEGSVSRDQFNFTYTLTLLCGEPVACRDDADITDPVSGAGGVDTAVTVTLEGWRKKRRRNGLRFII